jgi:glycosyltransferase involved in cell wall biosynthesis
LPFESGLKNSGSLGKRPLLTVCIPTYNAKPYIDVVLSTILPQSQPLGFAVEVLVVDDASKDGTTPRLTEAIRRGEIRYVRNAVNVGMANNIAGAISEHARGDFVWVLSQHNLLRPGALRRIIQTIQDNAPCNVFYVNFRCATFPEQWPDEVHDGYDGPFGYLSNEDVTDRALARWDEVLDAKTCSGTQTYAHIVRRDAVVPVLANNNIRRGYLTALDAYTQATAVASTMFRKPGFYIGDPCMTIFNGAQTWSSLESRSHVYLGGYPDLIKLYKKLGWQKQKYVAASLWGVAQARMVIHEILASSDSEAKELILRYALRNWRQPGVLRGVWSAYVSSQSSAAARTIGQTQRVIGKATAYYFRDWRPARWLRTLSR